MKKLLISILILLIGFTAYSQQNASAGFIRIEGGTFTMGSPETEFFRNDDEVQRQVTLSSFQMSIFPVTQREYQLIMGANPSHYKSDNLPVESVSWFDAVEYCNRRSQREGLTPVYTIRGTGNNRTVTWNRNANGYRLPTEAEWEYACRAGTTSPFNTGYTIAGQANFNESVNRTTPAGNYPANPWGLFDMHGNVWEWCWDWYGVYASGAQTNPIGAASGTSRIVRGGSLADPAFDIRSSCREAIEPSGKYNNIGFRVVKP